MIHQTKGLVLKQIKYGETSLIVTIFTELFGRQTYIINGVRVGGKNNKANLYQPGSLLEMQVYHNELKNLQRIKESKWSVLYRHIFNDVVKNGVALYMVELILKSVQQPEANEPLFAFCEKSLLALDDASAYTTAHYPIYFSLHLARMLGFELQNNYNQTQPYFDIREGSFVEENLNYDTLLSIELSEYISEFLRINDPKNLEHFRMPTKVKVQLLREIERFYQWHISEFGKMKTMEILPGLF